MADKDLKKILAELEEQGFEIIEKSKGLFVMSPDKTKPPVAIHRTPSDRRAWNNMLAQLKRSGFVQKRK